MSKYVLTFVIGFVFGILLMVMSNIQRGDSLDKAYERGYKDAHWFVKYDIEVNPTVVVDNLGRTWYRIDSTDTLPAVGPDSTLDSIKATLTVRTIYSIPPAVDSADRMRGKDSITGMSGRDSVIKKEDKEVRGDET